MKDLNFNYMTKEIRDWIRTMPINRDRLSYGFNITNQTYILYYDVPDLFISLFPLAICPTRTTAADTLSIITDDEIRTTINERLDSLVNRGRRI